jgi:flagellar basal-body rod protein FlgG
MAYVGVADIIRDSAQGPAISTGNPTDLMIEGEGFLRVQTPDGERYTRNGVLSVSPDGILTSSDGYPVMGDKGDIVLKGSSFQINDQGEVWQNGHLADKLKVFTFANETQLERVGLNYFYYGGEPEGVKPVALPHVRQGFLEGSNVNAIKNLTDMIVAHRSYEAYQKAVSNYDQIMQRSSNSIGEVKA